jgi:hypothetical protein
VSQSIGWDLVATAVDLVDQVDLPAAAAQ